MVVQLTECRVGCKRYDGGYNTYRSINLANFFFAHTKGEQGSCTCPSAKGSNSQKIHSWKEKQKVEFSEIDFFTTYQKRPTNW